MLRPREALAFGLVHKVVGVAELLGSAEELASRALELPDAGRQATKSFIRAELSQRWEEGCAAEAEGAWEMLSKPGTVAQLRSVLKRLSRRKGTPPSSERLSRM